MRPPVPLPGEADGPLWYKDVVIYETHVRAFSDSNGDGFGDFRGLTSRLDYLRDLGVNAIWVLPFYPSPLRDDGYDISDYRGVHQSYGTLRDFRQFLHEAHRRGLRVITELVLAHTSDQHPWFQRARRAKKNSTYRDFYVWSDLPDKFLDARIIFKDFEVSNWAFDHEAGAYYWHRFYSHQPSLNYDNPAVKDAMFAVVDYWFNMGVDGLRLDAVPYLFQRENTSCENLPETIEFCRELRRHVDERFSDKMLLAEANQWPEDAVAYFSKGDGCHMCFHFPLMPRLFMAARQEDRFPILDILAETPSIPNECQWALFLRNHDELTLEMVTDEERDYMYRAYAEDPQARLNVGIRRRLAPLLGNDRTMIEMMNGLLASLPGTPIIYYGDEIGMGDNIYLGDRNGVRTPMQWDSDRNAGFSEANPQRLFLPVVIDPEFHPQAVNVAAQDRSPSSLLWWMKRLLNLRSRFRAFSRGSIELLLPDNRKVLAFLRSYEGENVLVVANLSRFTQYVELDLSRFRGMVPVELFGGSEFPPIGDLSYFITLGPHGFYWFSLEVAEEMLARPRINLRTLDDLFNRQAQRTLEEILVDYVASRRWFRDKTRRIASIEIEDVVPIARTRSSPVHGYVLVLKLEFDRGHLERYVLPVAPLFGEVAEDTLRFHSDLVITELSLNGAGGVLVDGVYDRNFVLAVTEVMARRRQLAGKSGRLVGAPTALSRGIIDELGPSPTVNIISGEQSNSSVVVGEQAVMKLVRHLEPGPNPDVELGRYLHERAHFAYSPAVIGSLEYRPDGEAPTSTVGIWSSFVQNEGDGWGYVLDALSHDVELTIAQQNSEPQHLAPARLLEAARKSPEQDDLLVGPHLLWSELLGRRTAEMHLALSSAVEPGLSPEPLTIIDRQAMLHGARSLVRRSLRAVRSIPDRPSILDELREHEQEILDRLSIITAGPITAKKIRVHGDFHLGQALWTGKDFCIIDFEGEPARALSARRLRRSPLIDVAGMLRSFHYVSLVALSRISRDLLTNRDPAELEPLMTNWYRWIGGAFLRSYLREAQSAGFLPVEDQELQALLDFFLLEKAIYELGYEANSRPEWATIPARGVLELLELAR